MLLTSIESVSTRLEYLTSEWNSLWSMFIQPLPHPVRSITRDTLTHCVRVCNSVCVHSDRERKWNMGAPACDCLSVLRECLLMKTVNYLCVVKQGSGVMRKTEHRVLPGGQYKELHCLWLCKPPLQGNQSSSLTLWRTQYAFLGWCHELVFHWNHSSLCWI